MDPVAILSGVAAVVAALIPEIGAALRGGATPEDLIARARSAVQAIPSRPAGDALDEYETVIAPKRPK